VSDAYRDASGMLRAQIEEERAAITKLDAEIGDLGRALIAKSTLEAISDLRRSALRYFRTPDEARDVLEQSRALRDRLEEALVEKRACFLVDTGWPAPPGNAMDVHPISSGVREIFEHEFANAPIAAYGDGGAKVEIERNGVPVAIAIEPQQGGFYHQGWIAVRMPSTLPSLSVFREDVIDLVGQWLGLVKDIEVDDESFDDLFRVRGSKVVAELVLSPVARGLLEMLRDCPGGLSIAGGIAAYAWVAPVGKFDSEQAVVSLLVEIRRALTTRS